MTLLAAFLAFAAQGGPYDPDPKHPWNELHEALFTWRPSPRERIPGPESTPLPAAKITIPAGLYADPLFWPPGVDLWKFSAALLPVLDRIAAAKDAGLMQDPLKRAILQHDLWMFLDGLEGMPQGGGRSMPPGTEVERDAARVRIATLMRRIALTPAEIRALPDNLAAALASGRHATSFDPAEPDRPFLPKDLLDPNGPWALLGRADGMPAAEQHVKHFRGRSVFLVYASLPGGASPTLDYFRALGTLNKAKLPETAPEGSRFLLVRRPFLLDADGKPHVSPLVEEVRLRVSTKGAPAFEFHLSRSDLFAGVAGGLRAAGPRDEEVLFFFNRGSSKEPVRASCRECHGAALVLPAAGLRHAGRDRRTLEEMVTGIPLQAATVEQEAEATLKWKQADKSWEILRRFWPKE